MLTLMAVAMMAMKMITSSQWIEHHWDGESYIIKSINKIIRVVLIEIVDNSDGFDENNSRDDSMRNSIQFNSDGIIYLFLSPIESFEWIRFSNKSSKNSETIEFTNQSDEDVD